MPCTRCEGTFVSDHFYDRFDEQGRFRLGFWHWVSRCGMCGNVLDTADATVNRRSDALTDHVSIGGFQMFLVLDADSRGERQGVCNLSAHDAQREQPSV